MSLIFGSTAIKYHFSDYPYKPLDLDYISKEPVFSNSKIIVEYHWCDAMQYVLNNNLDSFYVDPDFLFSIKFSHLPWLGKNGKWFKHLKDFHFLQNKGCKLDDYLVKELRKEWSKRFGSKDQINLNVNPEEFFNSNVKRKCDHDWLHEYFKILDVPAYKLISNNDGTTSVNKNKFDMLTDYEKHCYVMKGADAIK